ncbi:ATP-binding cassette domain-containing protein [Salegentibacter sp. F188]|uniref:ATP-binding cassette domain-containing protein n=1 Tax=Autumnicola patrickiae TaxID=3075591 RepID=A0ABU3DZF8_9FLAO|nr:ATP-binding cassette domain-containing protein [Salegentibacter sp. F188]MDT0689023.1 ATP-binding cassette domain-containing protein [Salegentibacter sp. F188]
MAKGSSALDRLYGLLKLDRRDVLQTIYYAIFAGLLNLSVPLGIQAIVNLIQGGRVSTSWIVLVVLVTLAVGFVGVLELMQVRIVENLQQKIFTRSAFELTYRFPKIKMEELNSSYPPELANRFFDTIDVQKGVAKLVLDFPAALLQIFFGLILLSLYHPFFIIYGFLLVILLWLVFKFTARRGLDTSLDESKNKYKVAHWLQEMARALISFKISGKTSLAMKKSDSLTNKYLVARESHFGVLKIQYIKLIIFKVLVTGGLLVIGGMLVLNQEMNIGQFVAAEIIILLIMGSVEKLIKGLPTVYDLLTSLEKIGQVVDRDLEKTEGENTLSELPLTVELSDVSYTASNGNRIILKNISFTIPAGKKILIKGSNGSGRTTLLKVIAGILEPTKGQMYINNLSLKSLKINQYRGRLGVYLPEEFPFEGTLLENITFGDHSIPEKDVQWALEVMGLSGFVKEQPNGLNSIIFPEGKYLSSLIAKRIILARSIVRKPDILILKEPLELFEPEEASRLLQFFNDPVHPWSLIVASRNENWQKVCDETIILENGTIKN